MELIIGFILTCALAIWVYEDACKQNMSHPLLWCIAVAFLGIFVFPIYLLFRMKTTKEKSNSTSVNGVEKCSGCGKYYQKPAKFCPHCGVKISK